MFLDLVKDNLGDYKDAQTEVRFCCPFCDESSYKLYIQNKEPFLWHCKHCDSVGNPISFVERYYDISYSEAKDILLTYDYDVDNKAVSEFNNAYNKDLSESEKIILKLMGVSDNPNSSTHKEYQMVPYPSGFKLLRDNKGKDSASRFFNYLYSRGVTDKEINYHAIGYVESGHTLKSDGETIVPIYNSIVFTTFNDDGTPRYWNTRAIDKRSFVKSLNAPANDNQYGKFNSIFNLNTAKHTGRIIINEGVFNALTTGISGVATFGKQLTQEQLNMLVEPLVHYPQTEYYVFLDNDALKQNERVAEFISKYTSNVYLVSNPYVGKDANDLGREKTQLLIENAKKYTVSNSLKYLVESRF